MARFSWKSGVSKGGAAALVASLLGACGGGGSSDPATPGPGPAPAPGPAAVALTLASLSARPDAVSGGDALLAIGAPAGSDTAKITVRLNGADASGRFVPQPGGAALVGLVAGLQTGANRVEAFYDGLKSTELTLVNHPISGPVFSGPQQQPFVCETASFVLPDGTTLGAPLDLAACSVATRVHHLYWSSTQRRFVFLPDPAQVPADAETLSIGGRSVRFVVRIETGTINRAIYQTAVLHDPANDAPPTAFVQPAGWNRKLAYAFGGGCSAGGTGGYRQGTALGADAWYYDGAVLRHAPSVLDPELLRRGFAVASATLDTSGQNCTETTAVETLAMVKERFVESYGVPRYTLGWGCSGGTYPMVHAADSYPGLLDGVIAGCVYPELAFTNVHYVTDARLLNQYFAAAGGLSYSDTQKKAIGGVVQVSSLSRMDVTSADRVSATNCPDVLAPSLRYDPATKRDGARCDVFSIAPNVWGTKPNPLDPAAAPIARRPLDNVGVQYGLKALVDGVIGVDAFLDLNERIGGFDADGKRVASRSVADAAALPIAYEKGRMLYGGWGLKDMPIIDYRLYEDGDVDGAFHPRHHSFILRERLKKANGGAGNHVMLLEGKPSIAFSSSSKLVVHALEQMDLWLSAVVADPSADPLQQKVLRHRPATLREGCVEPATDYIPPATPGGAAGNFIAETMQMTSGLCASRYPIGIGARAVAGGPLVADVAKCQLRSVEAAFGAGTYGGAVFSPTQRERLQAAFPSGVCDWTRPGVGQPTAEAYRSLPTWHRFP